MRVTMSLGIATFPNDAGNQSKLIARADETLYLAKREGRNRAYAYCDVNDRIGEAEQLAS